MRFQVVVFFFSSRRRHTRLVSDWSSDVCSSDLLPARAQEEQTRSRLRDLERELRAADPGRAELDDAEQERLRQRSEERRVGKECRSRWRPDQSKKKQPEWTGTAAYRPNRPPKHG